MQFNRLTILKIESRSFQKKPRLFGYCKCECGSFKWITLSHVKSGHTTSCGCFRKEVSSQKMQGYKDIKGYWFNNIKRVAARRKIEFNITMEDIWDVWVAQGQKCALTGENLTWPNRVNSTHSGDASLDRIDSKYGYIVGNIQIVHKYINVMKLDHNQQDFIDMCIKVAAFRGLQPLTPLQSVNLTNDLGVLDPTTQPESCH